MLLNKSFISNAQWGEGYIIRHLTSNLRCTHQKTLQYQFLMRDMNIWGQTFTLNTQREEGQIIRHLTSYLRCTHRKTLQHQFSTRDMNIWGQTFTLNAKRGEGAPKPKSYFRFVFYASEKPPILNFNARYEYLRSNPHSERATRGGGTESKIWLQIRVLHTGKPPYTKFQWIWFRFSILAS